MAFLDTILDNPLVEGITGLGTQMNLWNNPLTHGLVTSQFGQREEAEQNISQMQEDIRQRISDRPLYEIPEETRQLMELYGQTAGDIRSASEQALGAAEARTGVQEAPGMALAKEQTREAAAGQRQNIIEAGGGSAVALGAIASAGQNELNALRDLAAQNQQYRSQAEQQYINQLGAHAGMLGQAAQLEGAGLGAMASERARVYESQLGQYQDLTQFDITQLGNVWAEEQARRNRNAQLLQAGIGAAGNVVGGLLGG
jgi:hypothetical protein